MRKRIKSKINVDSFVKERNKVYQGKITLIKDIMKNENVDWNEAYKKHKFNTKWNLIKSNI